MTRRKRRATIAFQHIFDAIGQGDTWASIRTTRWVSPSIW